MNFQYWNRVLIGWYEQHRRELPWRETSDPYLIWISEVILQQTRIVQGLGYYFRFTERFPDVFVLAEAHEDEVLKYWQGLGYYSRARNLHATAKEIVERFNGVFPRNYEELLSLKGIGEYTAAAICSLAWNQPYAVIDGNVYRVLARFFGIEEPIDSSRGKRQFVELAEKLLDKKQPGLYNQAIMDFGALQCTPKSPDCDHCPFINQCFAFISGKVNMLPVKKGKNKIKPRYFNYIDIHYQGNRLLLQRINKDIWQNLFEFPLIETDDFMDFSELQQTEIFQQLFKGIGNIKMIRQFIPKKHILSHRIIYTCFYKIEVDQLSTQMQHYRLIPKSDVEKYAVSRLIQLYLETEK